MEMPPKRLQGLLAYTLRIHPWGAPGRRQMPVAGETEYS